MALREIVARGHALTRAVETCPVPVIVAVNGLAYGGGCEITEAAPLALAAEHATFAKPEITLGFPPPFGGSQRLPRHVGRKRVSRRRDPRDQRAHRRGPRDRGGLVRLRRRGPGVRAGLDRFLERRRAAS
ncbi:hypothetical protein GCM10023215_38760 [Pseudonocardia yuanmonensis]|uniref:Enoyl-CoA hydratase/isomerase-like protein n=1 Tax=Pseudonocardia yuanmonensis TaxID=1095914 RepID=A0ABP8WYN4_9PSEU